MRRLRRVEEILTLRVNEEDRRVVEAILKRRRRRRFEAQGLPYEEQPRLPADYRGQRLGVAETLRLAHQRRLAMSGASGSRYSAVATDADIHS
jgi:hypothetical protein